MICYPRFLLVLMLLFAISLTGCAKQRGTTTDCGKWFVEMSQVVESVPIEQRYQKILEQIAKGCGVIPVNLKVAAQNSLEKSADGKRQILINAATTYFTEACIPDDPNIRASNLLHICLGSDYPDGEFSSITHKIDAASYLYGKALQNENEKAGVYKKYGKRILLNFFLSTAMLWETE